LGLTLRHSGRERLLVIPDVTEALLSCPWLQHGTHGEVLIRKQVALAILFEAAAKVAEQTLGFCEHGCMPYGMVHVQSDEPAEQQIVIELLHFSSMWRF
jgi:hypothetical protein